MKCYKFLGRTALHIAILTESQEIVENFIRICPESIKIGDNVKYLLFCIQLIFDN